MCYLAHKYFFVVQKILYLCVMPTPIPQAYKDAFISLIQVVSEASAIQVSSLVNNYEDIAIGLGYVADTIEQNQAYLTQLMACFPDIRYLNAVGIYVNQNNASLQEVTYTGVNIFVNCQMTGGMAVGYVPSPPVSPPITSVISVCLFNGSSVTGGLVINAGYTLNIIYQGSGTSIDVLDSSATNANVASITLMNVNTNPSTLSQIKTNSNYGSLTIQDGAIFGGIGYVAPDNSCATPVTSLTVGNVTHNTVPLTWTNPTNFLFVNVYYRKQQSPNWIQATIADGDFVKNTGFTFRLLSPDTAYEFSVIVTCNNGGQSTRTSITAQTSSSPA